MSRSEIVRRVVLFAVVVGVMVVSIHGQVEATGRLLGGQLATLFALTLDVGALLALNEMLSAPRRSPVRRWAWCGLVIAAGLSVGMNVWYAMTATNGAGEPVFPAPAAVAVGAGPVLLAGVLSHLLALSLTDDRSPREATTDVGTPPAAPAPAQDPSSTGPVPTAVGDGTRGDEATTETEPAAVPSEPATDGGDVSPPPGRGDTSPGPEVVPFRPRVPSAEGDAGEGTVADRMRRHVLDEWAAGRDVVAAEVDRRFGAAGYAKRIVRDLRAEYGGPAAGETTS